MKTCTRCGVSKDLSAFYLRGDKKGHRSECGDCSHADNQQRRPKYSAHEAERHREWSGQNKPHLAGYMRRKRSQTPEQYRNAHLLRKFGITLEQHDAMLATQGNACIICRRPFTKTPHVDHCHASGQVRGLLCSDCNPMLGFARDNPAVLKAAAEYLEGSDVRHQRAAA